MNSVEKNSRYGVCYINLEQENSQERKGNRMWKQKISPKTQQIYKIPNANGTLISWTVQMYELSQEAIFEPSERKEIHR